MRGRWSALAAAAWRAGRGAACSQDAGALKQAACRGGRWPLSEWTAAVTAAPPPLSPPRACAAAWPLLRPEASMSTTASLPPPPSGALSSSWLAPSGPGVRGAALRALGRLLHWSGLSDAAVAAVVRAAPAWPSLGHDPEGVAARVAALQRLLGAPAADAALRAAPGLLTRVPSALEEQARGLRAALGLDGAQLAALVAHAPHVLGADVAGVEAHVSGVAAALGLHEAATADNNTDWRPALFAAVPEWLAHSTRTLARRGARVAELLRLPPPPSPQLAALLLAAPQLIAVPAAALAARVAALERVLPPLLVGDAAAAIDARAVAAAHPALLLVAPDALARRASQLRGALPSVVTLPQQRLLALLERPSLEWDHLSFLQAARLLPVASETAASVAEAALLSDSATFKAAHPTYQPWRALRAAAQGSPAGRAWGWERELDTELVGARLTAALDALQQHRGRWARLLWLRARGARWWAQGAGAGAGSAAKVSEAPLSLTSVAMASDAEFDAAQPAFSGALPPMTADLPAAELRRLLSDEPRELERRVSAHLELWRALRDAARAAGSAAWLRQLRDWRAEVPHAVVEAGCFSTAGDGDERSLRAALWSALLDEGGAASPRLQRLRYAAAAGLCDDGALPLWRALAAPADAFDAAHPRFATWLELAAAAAGRRAWERELVGGDNNNGGLRGAELDAVLDAAARRPRRTRLAFLAHAGGGELWRSVGLAQALLLDDAVFGDLFPESRYAAWRALAHAAGRLSAADLAGVLVADVGGGADCAPARRRRGRPRKSAAVPLAAAVAAAPPPMTPRGDGDSGDDAATAAAAQHAAASAAPTTTTVSADRLATLSERAQLLLDAAERSAAWDAEARHWDAATWRAALEGFRPSLKASRLDFLLAAGLDGGSSGGTSAAAATLLGAACAAAPAFDARWPAFALWQVVRGAAAGVPAWRREWDALRGAELLRVLSAAGDACSGSDGGAAEARPTGDAGAGWDWAAPPSAVVAAAFDDIVVDDDDDDRRGRGSAGGAAAWLGEEEVDDSLWPAGGGDDDGDDDGRDDHTAAPATTSTTTPPSTAAAEAVARRLRFLSGHGRWRQLSLVEALTMPGAEFLAAFPAADGTARRAAREARAAARRRAADAAADAAADSTLRRRRGGGQQRLKRDAEAERAAHAAVADAARRAQHAARTARRALSARRRLQAAHATVVEQAAIASSAAHAAEQAACSAGWGGERDAWPARLRLGVEAAVEAAAVVSAALAELDSRAAMADLLDAAGEADAGAAAAADGQRGVEAALTRAGARKAAAAARAGGRAAAAALRRAEQVVIAGSVGGSCGDEALSRARDSAAAAARAAAAAQAAADAFRPNLLLYGE